MIDAITRGYAETYATVHRGVYQRSADMTLAFEAARRRIAALHRRRLGRRDRLRPRRDRGDQPRRAELGRHASQARRPRSCCRRSSIIRNIVPWQLVAERTGAEIDVAPLTADGRIDLDAMAAMLTGRHKLVALAHVSNVLGSVLDARRAAELAHAVGALLLLDGCQAVPRMPVDVAALGCDFYVFSGHKLYGPTGIGVLWARARAPRRDAARGRAAAR